MAAFVLQQRGRIVVTEIIWPAKLYYLGPYRKSLPILGLKWWTTHQPLLCKTRSWIKTLLSWFSNSSLKNQYLRLWVGPKTAQPSTWKHCRNGSRWQPCRSEQMPIFLCPWDRWFSEGRRISPRERILCAALILEMYLWSIWPERIP